MKKSLILFIFVIIISLQAELIEFSDADLNFTVISSDEFSTQLELEFGNFSQKSVLINNQEFNYIYLGKESFFIEKGVPQLPRVSRSVIIPSRKKAHLEISGAEYTDFDMSVAPSKGNFTRDINPADVPWEFGESYQTDEFFPKARGVINEPFILRDFRGITVTAQPFAYNHQQKILRVYHKLKLKLVYSDSVGRNPMAEDHNKINVFFNEIYQHKFINYDFVMNTRYPVLDDQGRLIVICYDNFLEEIAPYVNWKKQKGIFTDLYALSEIGSTANEIKTFIQTQYDLNDGLTFVQLIGDAQQIPTLSYDGGGSDPSFALLAGSDSYPDIFVGRFSAETEAEVETQVTRTIYYERDITSGAWLSKATGIASDQGTNMGDDGEIDSEHQDVIRAKLLNYHYTEVDQIYDPNASASQVGAALNEGRGLVGYTGHGNITGWSTTGFSNHHINALTNDNELPFIYCVACQNGNFVSYTCFAETWMRATNSTSGTATGAVAVFASSINQSWAPPMQAQDEYIDLLCGAGSYTGEGNQFNTIGGLWYNSEGQMLDESNATNMYKTWHIFGDASLQIRTTAPSAMSINHAGNIIAGQTEYTVSTGCAGIMVSLYDGTNIIGSGITDSSGNITLNLDPVPSAPIILTLTTSGYNKITTSETVTVLLAAGPYINILASHISAGGDTEINADETVQLGLTLANIGNDAATDVHVTLTSSDLYITFIDFQESVGNIAAGSQIILTDAFTFTTTEDIPHNHTIDIQVQIISNESIWNKSLQFTAVNPADIDISPQQLFVQMQADQTSIHNLILTNTGGAELSYNIRIINVDRERSIYGDREYCAATGGCEEYISNVSLGTINNSTTCDNYGDYTNISTDLMKGESYPISVTIGNPFSNDTGSIWIDWNQDSDFEDAGETIINSWSGHGPYTCQITVPETALDGATRMRVRLNWYAVPPICGTTNYGEVEDYTVNIQSSGPSWLDMNGSHMSNGSISAGTQNQVINLNFNSTGLSEATYNAEIVVSNNSTTNPEQIIPVQLYVSEDTSPHPVITVNPGSFDFEIEQNSPGSSSFTISNTGSPETNLTYLLEVSYPAPLRLRDLERLQKESANMTEAEYKRFFDNIDIEQTILRTTDWLEVTPVSGSCQTGESDLINLNVSTSELAIGNYDATITITNNAGNPVVIPITLSVISPPIDNGIRNIAEFEPMQGALIRYPFGIPLTLIAEISEDVMVYTIVDNESQKNTVISQYNSNNVNMNNCEYLITSSNSVWTRDYGPWYIENEGNIEVVDFEYNRPRPADNDIPDFVAAHFEVASYDLGLIHTGGNYMTDGMGISISSHIAYSENPGYTETEVDEIMQTNLGIDSYHVVSDPNHTYIDHVDCWGKFLDVDKLLIRSVPNTHVAYTDLENTVSYFQSQISSYGTPYQIFRVYTPNDQPYTNSLILNNKVYVPIMNNAWDDDAITVYETAMPGYEVISVFNNTNSPWQGTDALHCRVKEIADFGMLSIQHTPPAEPTSRNIEIAAEIIAYSGEPVYTDQCKVYYKYENDDYSAIVMTQSEDNIYTAIIPSPQSNDQLTYYITASDASGRTSYNPFIGVADPHIIPIAGTGFTPQNLVISISGNDVILSWSIVPNVTGYKIYRSSLPDAGFEEIGTTISNTITLENAVDTDHYFYRVTAY